MQKYGVKVDFFPFIKVEGVTLREFRSQRIEILEHSVILFTSRTTIDHFFRICEEARVTIPESMKYLCHTEAIALYLQKYIVYRKRKIFFADGTFQGFMELALKHRDERMLLTLSEPYNPEISTAMEKLKFKFDKVVLSHAVARDLSGLKPSDYDLMVCYAPAEITALAAAFPADKLPMIATFGVTTARAAADSGIPVRVMAPTPQVPSMTKAIDLFIARIHAGEEVPPVTPEHNSQVEEFVKAQEAKPMRRTRSKRTASVSGKPGAPAKTPAKPSTKATATRKPATPGSAAPKITASLKK